MVSMFEYPIILKYMDDSTIYDSLGILIDLLIVLNYNDS